ncbi:MAG: Holliday junction branch migration protein RuvA [Coriobacteriaceae bacterium]|jgi:Holliday junction DNA helicase RuvA|nr:Holliday junction branch migration protein RuvA [Coriobacteriaceae bacterium]
MIAFIKGTLAHKSFDTVYVETGGIGYALGMATSDLAKLPDLGAEVTLYTYLYVREDALSLYGFLSLEEKNLFLRLTSVSGVGPKVALAALSVFEPADLVAAVTAQDITAISRIPGIGKKTASRIVLELKGSLEKDLLSASDDKPASAPAAFQAAREALLSMGFTSEETELALKDASDETSEAALLQYALKRLGA